MDRPGSFSIEQNLHKSIDIFTVSQIEYSNINENNSNKLEKINIINEEEKEEKEEKEENEENEENEEKNDFLKQKIHPDYGIDPTYLKKKIYSSDLFPESFIFFYNFLDKVKTSNVSESKKNYESESPLKDEIKTNENVDRSKINESKFSQKSANLYKSELPGSNLKASEVKDRELELAKSNVSERRDGNLNLTNDPNSSKNANEVNSPEKHVFMNNPDSISKEDRKLLSQDEKNKNEEFTGNLQKNIMQTDEPFKDPEGLVINQGTISNEELPLSHKNVLLYFIMSYLAIIIFTVIISAIYKSNNYPTVCGFACNKSCLVKEYKIANFLRIFYFYILWFALFMGLLIYVCICIVKKIAFELYFIVYFLLIIGFVICFLLLQAYFDSSTAPNLIGGIIVLLLYLLIFYVYLRKDITIKQFFVIQWPLIQILFMIYLSVVIIIFGFSKLIANNLLDNQLGSTILMIFFVMILQELFDLFILKLNPRINKDYNDKYSTLISRINYPFFWGVSIVWIIYLEKTSDIAISLIFLTFLEFAKRVGWKQYIFYFLSCKKLFSKEKPDFLKIMDATKIESTFWPWVCLVIFKISDTILLPARNLYTDCFLTAIKTLKPSAGFIIVLVLQQFLLDFGSAFYDKFLKKKIKCENQNKQLYFPRYYSGLDIFFICGMSFSTCLLGIVTFGFFIDEMPPNYKNKFIQS